MSVRLASPSAFFARIMFLVYNADQTMSIKQQTTHALWTVPTSLCVPLAPSLQWSFVIVVLQATKFFLTSVSIYVVMVS